MLTNKQIGHILLIPAYLLFSGLVLLFGAELIIEIQRTPIKELLLDISALIIVMMTILGAYYLDKK